MMLQKYFRTFCIFACALLIIFYCKHSIAQDAAEFEDFFKNIDMEQLAKDMEKVFAEIEEHERLGKTKIQEKQDDTKKIVEKKTTPKISAIKPSNKTIKQLFLEPETIEIQHKNKTILVPTPQSLEAAREILNQLTTHTQQIDKRVQGSTYFGPDYQEKFLSRFGRNTDAIDVATNHIISKRTYQNILLTPPAQNKELVEQMKTLRKKIIDALESAEKINEKIEATTTQASDQGSSDFDKLAALQKAQESRKAPVSPAPKKASERKQKQRGKKDAISTEETVQSDDSTKDTSIIQSEEELNTKEKTTKLKKEKSSQTNYLFYVVITIIGLLLLAMGGIRIKAIINSKNNKQSNNADNLGENNNDEQ